MNKNSVKLLTCNIVCVYDQIMNLEEKLYTSTEVADILGVSLRSVYRYMEESKLQADVKTATGRHRFTKQNILDFLYPEGSARPSQQPQTAVRPKVVSEEPMYPSEPLKPRPIQEQVVEKTPEPIQEPLKEEQESPVDWLAKFREAASKFKSSESQEVQEPVSTPVQPNIQVPQVKTETVVSTSSTSSISDLSGEKYKEEKPEVYYYRSMLGGLKEIAQSIDKNARRAYVDYAFTMNAGLSLHKPIKPFSVLHFYVRLQDREFFERILNLIPAEPRDAQLCIMTDKNGSALQTKKEMHGLYVVSEKQLKSDLLEYGETELASELDSIVSN